MIKSSTLTKAVLAATATFSLGVSMAGVSLADDKKAPEIEYRQNLFKVVYASISNVRSHASGKYAPGGNDAALNNARALAAAAANVKEAFRANTVGKPGKTAALPAIWENYEDFSARADKFAADTAALLAAAESGGNLGGAVRKVFSNCKGCHDNYKD